MVQVDLKKFFALKEQAKPIPTFPSSSPESHLVSDIAHQHVWTEKARTYAPPRRDLTGLEQIDEKVLLGVTTLVFECQSCHEMGKHVLLGSDKTQLDDILDSVEKTGGQYYQRGDITFVIQRYQQQQPTSVTLR